jgi:hypothetical protein
MTLLGQVSRLDLTSKGTRTPAGPRLAKKALPTSRQLPWISRSANNGWIQDLSPTRCGCGEGGRRGHHHVNHSDKYGTQRTGI